MCCVLVNIGLALANVLKMVRENPGDMLSLFHSVSRDITIHELQNILIVEFSDVGSNAFEQEQLIFLNLHFFLQDVNGEKCIHSLFF